LKRFRNVLLAILLFAGVGRAEDAARFKRLSEAMICTCSCGQALFECRMPACGFRPGMQAELHKMLDEGKSDDEIKQAFITKYGTTVLIVPTTHGFDITAWIMPFAALITGLLAVVFVVYKWRKTPAAAGAGPIDVKLQDRVEEELKKFTPED
jgi:cytochrome c-type biogenesis protein CcmH